MKALLVIELDDNRDINELQVDYQVLEKDGDDYIESCVAEDTAAQLILLPEKYTEFVQAADENDEYQVYEEISTNGERRGWNDCIDEILGGK